MSTYQARVWREGDWWVIEVEGFGATQVKTLDKVEYMARALVADMEDVPVDAIAVQVELPGGLGPALEDAERQARAAEELADKAAAARRSVAQDLVKVHKLPNKDVAAILKVSPGRITQLMGDTKKKRRRQSA